jgi:hypothetical protein
MIISFEAANVWQCVRLWKEGGLVDDGQWHSM